MKGPTSGGAGSGRGLPEPELRAILDGMAQVMEQAFDRLDDQTRALHKLTAAVEALGAKLDDGAGADPDRVAGATARAVSQTLVPELHKIVDTMEGLTGGKALLRERWRAFDREEARQGRWRFQPLAVSLGIPLALGLLLAAFMPSAVAQTPLTCRGAGGWWWVATERYPAVCVFEAHGRLHQATGQVGEADAGSS
jgi:hypothetical protein